MKLQDQETDGCNETSQRLVLTVAHIAVKTKMPLPHSFRSQPRKEQGYGGLIALILAGKLVFQGLHFSLHHGSIDGGKASQEHSRDNEIASCDRKSQADDKTPEIEGLRVKAYGPEMVSSSFFRI